MSWPIMLTEKQSSAITRELALYVGTLEGEQRAMFVLIQSQMRRGIALDPEEQDLLYVAMRARARSLGHDAAFESGCFKIWGEWLISPPYWSGTFRPRT